MCTPLKRERVQGAEPSPWERFWRDPRTQRVLVDVLVALLISLLSILGYDVKVTQPRVEALQKHLIAVQQQQAP